MAYLANSVTPWPADAMEPYRWLEEYLLGQPGTEKRFHPAWQAYKYLLCGKMYAYIGVNDQNKRPILTLKLEPVYSDMLRRQYAGVVPGYYMNPLYWSTAYLDGEVPREVLTDMVHASYQVLFTSLSKKAQGEILGRDSAE